MKKLVLFAALLLSGGILFAEPIANGPRSPGKMEVWKSTDVVAITSGTINYGFSAFIHQVIISSPAQVDTSTDAVLTLYGRDPRSIDPPFGRIQVSTREITTDAIQRWTFDIYASTGFSVKFSTGALREGQGVDINQAGSAQILYKDYVPEDFKVWASSFIPVESSTKTIAKGPVLLHKVAVNKIGTGAGGEMRIFNAYTTSTVVGDIIAEIDMKESAREYDFDVMLTSGLTVNFSTGTVYPDVTLFYKTNPPRDWEWWIPILASGAMTDRVMVKGRCVFGGVLSGDAVAGSSFVIYDATVTNTPKMLEIGGDTVFDFDDANYEMNMSSGIMATTKVGVPAARTGKFTIRYRRLR